MTTGQEAKQAKKATEARQATGSQPPNAKPQPGTTMRAIVQEGYGTPDVLRLAYLARPAIAEDQVLVKVHAAGLDRGTWHIASGLPYVLRLAYGFRTPKHPIPGLDLAGTVEAVGAKVTRFAVGDQVFGAGRGTFAEYSAARENQLALKPATISFEQAAVVPVSACTALQALRAGGITPTQGSAPRQPRVLVSGASGGVGSYAVQFAKLAGAEVTAVCSTGKMDLVRTLGADHVLDYTTQDFLDGSEQYDVIIDIAGNPAVSRLRRALTPTGTAVITGGEEGGSWTGGLDRQLRAVTLSPFIRQKLTMIFGSEPAEDLEYIAGLLGAGALVPAVDRSYPLEQTPDAMRYFDAGKARGKLVITI